MTTIPGHKKKYNICIIGGGGYVGYPLTLKLAHDGHKIKNIDTFWYGQYPTHPLITNKKEDLRNLNWNEELKGIDIVYLLACISNDPSSELDHQFTSSINDTGVNTIIHSSKESGVKRLIYASSSSVYGIKKEPLVTENLSLTPLTLYSQLKVKSEELIQDLTDHNFDSIILRPATVFGPSKRLRLDVVINLLASHAFFKREISIFGGDQFRPNIYIDDIVNIYTELADLEKENYQGEAFNIGVENLTVNKISELIEKHCPHPIKVSTIHSDDNRSYRIDSSKAKETFKFNNYTSIESGIKQLFSYFSHNPHINPDNISYNNVRRMKNLLENKIK